MGWYKSYIEDFKLGTTTPGFFSKASFRFGHSIVRKKYRISQNGKFPLLSDLFKPKTRLTKDHVIDWKFFFSKAEASKTEPLDTHITEHMQSAPGVRSHGTVNVVMKNLEATCKVIPTSGHDWVTKFLEQQNSQDIKKELGLTHCTSMGRASFASLESKQFSIQTLPLWLYILLEAQQETNSNKLGVLGSMLNAEVLFQSIQNSEFTLFINGTYEFQKAVESLGPIKDKLFVKRDSSYRAKNKESIMFNLINLVNDTNN
jgi:hypothetical protein